MKRNILIGISIAIAIFIIFISHIIIRSSQPLGVIDIRKIQVQKFNPEISNTYKESYSKLITQLQYARVITNPTTNNETMKVINNKNQLIEIVREFDKLRATKPKEYNFEGHFTHYTIVMWRKGSSVTYVLVKCNNEFYEGSTCVRSYNNKLVLRKLPSNLVKLLDF